MVSVASPVPPIHEVAPIAPAVVKSPKLAAAPIAASQPSNISSSSSATTPSSDHQHRPRRRRGKRRQKEPAQTAPDSDIAASSSQVAATSTDSTSLTSSSSAAAADMGRSAGAKEALAVTTKTLPASTSNSSLRSPTSLQKTSESLAVPTTASASVQVQYQYLAGRYRDMPVEGQAIAEASQLPSSTTRSTLGGIPEGQSDEDASVVGAIDGTSSNAPLSTFPSSSSSLFIASRGKASRHAHELHATASIAPSADVYNAGVNTYDYDIANSVQRQQARRRRGDSNASISTIASMISYTSSLVSSIMGPDETHQYAQGHFVGNDSTQATSGAAGGGAADSLRRIRKRSDAAAARATRYPATATTSGTNGVTSPHNGTDMTTGGQTPLSDSRDGPAAPQLTDTLENLIANSASYRAANAQRRTGAGTLAPSAGGGGGGVGGNGGQAYNSNTLGARHRKDSQRSLRSLAAFTSSANRQSSEGDFRALIGAYRPASLFGFSMGGGREDAMGRLPAGRNPSARFPSLSRSSALAPPSLSREATGVVTNDTASNSGTTRPMDAMGSLRGLRGLDDILSNSATRQSKQARPALLTRYTTNSLPPAAPGPLKKDTQAEKQSDGHEDIKKDGLKTPNDASQGGSASPTDGSNSYETVKRPGDGSASAETLKRHVNFLPPSSSTTSIASNATGRRAFAAIDPTSARFASASGSTTPLTIRSASPPLSRKASSTNLSALGEAGQPRNNGGLETTTRPDGAMPALDSALARAEDRSGLKTSSRCTNCGKKVVNAPVTKSGDVFCSRDCRIEVKRKRQAGASLVKNQQATQKSAESSVSALPSPASNGVDSAAASTHEAQGSIEAAP